MGTTTDRPLPSERIDAAAERLKAENPPEAPKPKRAKSPSYMVLRRARDGDWQLLTDEPITASSRKEAASKAGVHEFDASATPVEQTDTFAVILAEHWQTVTRTLKPPEQPFVEEWA